MQAEMFVQALQTHVVFKVIVIGLLAGVCEEMLFRGPIQVSLLRKAPAWAAIGFTAVLFAAIHIDAHGFLVRAAGRPARVDRLAERVDLPGDGGPLVLRQQRAGPGGVATAPRRDRRQRHLSARPMGAGRRGRADCGFGVPDVAGRWRAYSLLRYSGGGSGGGSNGK